MLLSLTVLTHQTVEAALHSNLAWAMAVKLLSFDWYLQMYTRYKSWYLDRWKYDQLHKMGEKLGELFRNACNVEHIFVLLKHTYLLFI